MLAAAQETPSTHRRPLYADTNLQIVFGITLMAVMGVASITPAFPSVVRRFGISSAAVGLLISAFTLPGIVLTPVTGVLADRYGRKRILVPSLFLFALSGTLCWFARDFDHLLVLRFVQGSSAASLGALNIALVGDLYAGRDRAAAMGYNASVLSVGTASYPAIGGLLAVLGWNYPFLLASLAAPVGLFVLFSLKSPEPRTDWRLGEYLCELWRDVKTGRAVALLTLSLLTFIALYGSYFTYLPLLLGTRFAASSVSIGAVMSLMSLTTAITSTQIGRLSGRFSDAGLLTFAYICYGLALAIIPFVPSLWFMSGPALIFGIGHGINVPTVQTLLAAMAPLERRGAFMSANGMALRTGQTLGPLLMAAAMALAGFPAPFFAGVCVAVAMLSIVVTMPVARQSVPAPRQGV